MKEKLRKQYLKSCIKYIFPKKYKKNRTNLKNKNFTIISDNC